MTLLMRALANEVIEDERSASAWGTFPSNQFVIFSANSTALRVKRNQVGERKRGKRGAK